MVKELSLCHKLWIYNPDTFATQCRTSLIFQTYIVWSNRIHILKYLRSTTLESKDTRARKVKFVAKTQVLWKMLAAIFLIWKQLPLRCMWGPTKKLFSRKKSNWVYCSHSNVLIPLFLKPVNLWYFKLKLFGLTGTKLKVWNIKGLRHQGINNLSLWQEISSFRIPEYEQNWWCMKRDFENKPNKPCTDEREKKK